MSIQTERLKSLRNELLAQEEAAKEAAKRRKEELDEKEKKNAEEFLREGIWKYFELLLKKNPHQTTLILRVSFPKAYMERDNERPNVSIVDPDAELNFSSTGLWHAHKQSSKFGISSQYIPDDDWGAPQQIAFRISIGD